MDRPHGAGAARAAAGLARLAAATHAAADRDGVGARHRAVEPWPAAGAAGRPAGQWLADELGRRGQGDLVQFAGAARPGVARSGAVRAAAHLAPLAGLDAD